LPGQLEFGQISAIQPDSDHIRPDSGQYNHNSVVLGLIPVTATTLPDSIFHGWKFFRASQKWNSATFGRRRQISVRQISAKFARI